MMLQVLLYHQDDPRKCTAAKMVKFGLARPVRRIRGSTLVLDPYSGMMLMPSDRSISGRIAGLDCSWNRAAQTLAGSRAGTRRSLPPLLAGNPVNYARVGRLTTAEALSGALFILGFRESALAVLDKFKWGHTFYELNQNLLEEYAVLESQDQVSGIARQYGLAG